MKNRSLTQEHEALRSSFQAAKAACHDLEEELEEQKSSYGELLVKYEKSLSLKLKEDLDEMKGDIFLDYLRRTQQH